MQASFCLADSALQGHTEFTPLLDRIAVAAARAGSDVGFTGLLLEVGSMAVTCTEVC